VRRIHQSLPRVTGSSHVITYIPRFGRKQRKRYDFEIFQFDPELVGKTVSDK
jgi:hypothetical protein